MGTCAVISPDQLQLAPEHSARGIDLVHGHDGAVDDGHAGRPVCSRRTGYRAYHDRVRRRAGRWCSERKSGRSKTCDQKDPN